MEHQDKHSLVFKLMSQALSLPRYWKNSSFVRLVTVRSLRCRQFISFISCTGPDIELLCASGKQFDTL